MILQSQKFTLLDEVIHHQLTPSFWKLQLPYYSSASQILADFGAHFIETQARSSNRPVYFSDLCTRCRPIGTTDTQLRSYVLTLLQPGDIVCTVHYHKKISSRFFFSHFESTCVECSTCEFFVIMSRGRLFILIPLLSFKGPPLLDAVRTEKLSAIWIEDEVTSFIQKLKSKENCEEFVDTFLTKWEFCCDRLLSDLVRKR